MTRSPLLALFIFAQGIVHLKTLSNEPEHPQEVVALLLALTFLVIAGGLKRPWTLVLLGAIRAALAYTKINVGAFFGFALLLAYACHTPVLRSRCLWWVVALSGLLPFLLMRQDLGQDWARIYAAHACAGVVAAGVVVYSLANERKLGLSQWCQVGLGYIGLSIIVVAVLLLTGTSLVALVHNLLGGHATGIFHGHCIPLKVTCGYWSGAAALLFALITVACRRHLARLSLVIATAKGLYGVLGALVLVLQPRYQMGQLLPWIWLLMLPSGRKEVSKSDDTFPAPSSVLWRPGKAFRLILSRAVRSPSALSCSSLFTRSVCTTPSRPSPASHGLPGTGSRLSPRAGLLRKTLVFTSLLYLFAAQWCTPFAQWRYYASLSPLDLPGAHYLHIPAYQADGYRELTDYVEREGDTFITVPSPQSLYFWTHKVPPTYLSASGEVIAALRRAKRPLIIINDGKLMINERKAELPRSAGPIAKDPLVVFVDDTFVEIKRLGSYRILAPKTVTMSATLGETSQVN